MILLRRLLQIAAMLAALSLGLFLLLHAMPGNAEDLLLASNPELRAEDLDRLRKLRGMDRPILERYTCWLFGKSDTRCEYWPSEQGILGGDLGWSSVHKLPVETMLRLRLPATLTLMIPAFLLALAAAILAGVYAALKKDHKTDHAISALAFLGISLPLHWLGLLAILIFAVQFPILPSSGIHAVGDASFLSHAKHALLPILVLAYFYAGRWTRYVRSSTLEVLNLDFIRTARAKGLPEREVIWRHAVPNALLPLVTVVAQSIPALFSGTVIIERVFSYPGMGMLIFESVTSSDFLVAIVVFLAYAALTMFAALLADALYALLDPRVRAGAPLEGGR